MEYGPHRSPELSRGSKKVINISPKKLLFFLPRFHTNIYWGLRALSGAGHSVSVIAFNTQDQQELHDVIRPIVAKGMSQDELTATIKTLEPDCLIIRGSVGTSELAYRHARKHSIPLIKYDQAAVPSQVSLFRWLKRVRDPKPADYRISPVPRKRFTDRGNRREFFLPFPVKLANVARRRPNDGKIRILCVGKLLQPRKNHDHVLSALSHMGVSAGRFEVTFCGTSNACSGMSSEYYRQLKARASELAKIVKVSFLENVEFASMERVYAEADVCILPAFREPLGSAPLEAMSFGVIPFISRESGSSKYLIDGFNGYVINPSDPWSTGKKLLNLMDNEHLKSEMADRAREFSQTELCGDAFVERFETILRRVLG